MTAVGKTMVRVPPKELIRLLAIEAAAKALVEVFGDRVAISFKANEYYWLEKLRTLVGEG